MVLLAPSQDSTKIFFQSATEHKGENKAQYLRFIFKLNEEFCGLAFDLVVVGPTIVWISFKPSTEKHEPTFFQVSCH